MAIAPQMVTANRLSDGAVVYYTEAKGWSENFADGAVWPDKGSADGALVASEDAVKARLIVGPYLFDVVAVAGVVDQGQPWRQCRVGERRHAASPGVVVELVDRRLDRR